MKKLIIENTLLILYTGNAYKHITILLSRFENNLKCHFKQG